MICVSSMTRSDVRDAVVCCCSLSGAAMIEAETRYERPADAAAWIDFLDNEVCWCVMLLMVRTRACVRCRSDFPAVSRCAKSRRTRRACASTWRCRLRCDVCACE
jgi:hypothetical protein